MARKPHTLVYGSDTLTVEIDESFLAGPPIAPRLGGGGKDPDEAIQSALSNPRGRPKLKEMARGKRVAVVVSDEFRFGLQGKIVEHYCKELAGSGAESVVFICATGSHDPAVYASNIEKLVSEHASQHGLDCRFEPHDCDKSRLVDVGKTSRGVPVVLNGEYMQANLRVFGHESKHHYMAGFSSIDKQVLPGVSSRATIEGNHKLSLSADSGPGRSPWHADPERKDNPFSDDARECRALADKVVLDPQTGTLTEAKVETFGMDMISSGGAVHWILAGDPAACCAEMTGEADRTGMFEVERARYVLISPGGPPASQALYGTQNCFDMALKGAIEKGGEVCVVAPCEGRPELSDEVRGIAPDIKSKKLFWDNLVRMKSWTMADALKYADENFELYLWKTIRVLRLFIEENLKIGIHCTLPADRLEEGGFTAVPDVQAWVDDKAGRGDGKLWVIDKGNTIFVQGK